jgi:hypothetical protein
VFQCNLYLSLYSCLSSVTLALAACLCCAVLTHMPAHSSFTHSALATCHLPHPCPVAPTLIAPPMSRCSHSRHLHVHHLPPSIACPSPRSFIVLAHHARRPCLSTSCSPPTCHHGCPTMSSATKISCLQSCCKYTSLQSSYSF